MTRSLSSILDNDNYPGHHIYKMQKAIEVFEEYFYKTTEELWNKKEKNSQWKKEKIMLKRLDYSLNCMTEIIRHEKDKLQLQQQQQEQEQQEHEEKKESCNKEKL